MRASITGSFAAAALLFSGASQAAPIFTVSGGSVFNDVGNDFLWIDSDVTEGGTLALSEPGQVTVEYIGKEAGFPGTEFWFGALAPPDGTRIVATNSGVPVIEGSTAAAAYPPPGITRELAPYQTTVAAGTVPFYFRVPGNGDAIVPNGGGPSGMGDIAFWWRTGTGQLENVVYVLLDDAGGFNPGEPSDNDHDDMIVRLTVTPVPEPSSGLFLALGLAGLARWRRRVA